MAKPYQRSMGMNLMRNPHCYRPPILGRGVGFVVVFGSLMFLPAEAWALQVHEAPEGLVAHQLAHVFFTATLALLAYWLKAHRFVQEKGWRLIQVACLLLILWNTAALIGHWAAGRVTPDLLVGDRGSWSQRILTARSHWAAIYYFLSLDHLVCVPAILFLFLGIRKLYKEIEPDGREG